MAKNTVPTELYCWKNQFTKEGLNALFGTLHASADDKRIDIGNNPGAGGCNKNIATAKGREVVD